MSVTGEALKTELAQRWFAAQPGIKLVNAYGLTETSDDTNHEVMDRAPEGEPGAARPAGQQRAHLRRRREPGAGAAGRGRADRLLRGLRRPRVRQRPRAHPAVPTWPTRTARASGSTWAATTAAGGPTASWSSSAAATARSRSAASASRSARSRTPCCGCPASATARWWSPAGAGQGKRLMAFYCRPAATCRPRCLRDRLGELAARVHGPGGLPLAGNPAADRQQQDRQEVADRAGGRTGRRRGRSGLRRAGHAHRAAAGGRVGEGARHPARIRSAGTTTSSTGADRRCWP